MNVLLIVLTTQRDGFDKNYFSVFDILHFVDRASCNDSW